MSSSNKGRVCFVVEDVDTRARAFIKAAGGRVDRMHNSNFGQPGEKLRTLLLVEMPQDTDVRVSHGLEYDHCDDTVHLHFAHETSRIHLAFEASLDVYASKLRFVETEEAQ